MRYYSLVWYITTDHYVLQYKFAEVKHYETVDVRLLADVEGKYLVVPRLTHANHIYLDRLLSLNGNLNEKKPEVKAMMKTRFRYTTNEKPDLIIKSIRPTKIFFYFSMLETKEVEEGLKRLGVKHIIQQGKWKRCIIQSPSSRMNWFETQKFCEEKVNSTSLMYYSYRELMELSGFFKRRSLNVFTGFQTAGQV